MAKTDNHDPAAKLELRRHFLRKYHADDPAHVLDCCQGSGVLWGQLRREFGIASYWGLDVKPKKGRLKIDSVRVLQQPGWTQNVIDVDTYGSPWKHWFAILANLRHKASVFLTFAAIRMGGGSPLTEWQSHSLGLGELKLPQAIQAKLHDFSVNYVLTRCCDFGLIATSAIESVSDGNARYFGVRLEPKGS